MSVAFSYNNFRFYSSFAMSILFFNDAKMGTDFKDMMLEEKEGCGRSADPKSQFSTHDKGSKFYNIEDDKCSRDSAKKQT